MFYAYAYDTEAGEYSIVSADKSVQDCYHASTANFTVHYLLRQKPYQVRWCDHHMAEIEEALKPRDEIGLCERTLRYFHNEEGAAIKYDGYLINHSQKMAVDLADYYKKSRGLTDQGQDTVIDVIPVLTESGGGTGMILADGMSAETTEELIGAWSGDRLQIVTQLPVGYEVISCCFSHIWERCKYCFAKSGVDENGYVLRDRSGNRYEAAQIYDGCRRGATGLIKMEAAADQLRFTFNEGDNF